MSTPPHSPSAFRLKPSWQKEDPSYGRTCVVALGRQAVRSGG